MDDGEMPDLVHEHGGVRRNFDMAILESKTKPKPASAKAAAKTSDVLLEVAKEVETLSREKAFALADDLIAEGGISDFKLGGVFAVIHDKAKAEGGQEWLEGHESFEELCDVRFGTHYRKAMYLIDIYKNLVEEQISWDVVKDVPWTKLALLASHKMLTEKNAEGWAAKAQKLSRRNLEALLKKKFAPGCKSKTTTFIFKVHKDQEDAIREALDKAKHQTKTDFDTVALFNVMQGYLGNAVTIDAETTALEEKPKQKNELKEYWLARLRKVYDEIESDLGSNDVLEEVVLKVAGEKWEKVTINVVMPE